MKVILRENEDAEDFFEELINKAVDRVSNHLKSVIEEVVSNTDKSDDQWVSTEEAKRILGIKSKNKIQQLRDESPMNGLIVSQHGRTYRYFKPSLYKFLDKHKLK
ncbi:hypothetical protein QQ008_07285 [Fulvivirgaceae bacterium BMA10]|uniref:Helix-turn-helix domain-containing protein n=1 Tax=Splendidivirga corallicola TaxID=3051826 RepID=A0ABT8KKC2_9BACT|nr:hypothetical protein [Fulvivirgaceae bacterium BMA10]